MEHLLHTDWKEKDDRMSRSFLPSHFVTIDTRDRRGTEHAEPIGTEHALR